MKKIKELNICHYHSKKFRRIATVIFFGKTCPVCGLIKKLETKISEAKR